MEGDCRKTPRQRQLKQVKPSLAVTEVKSIILSAQVVIFFLHLDLWYLPKGLSLSNHWYQRGKATFSKRGHHRNFMSGFHGPWYSCTILKWYWGVRFCWAISHWGLNLPEVWDPHPLRWNCSKGRNGDYHLFDNKHQINITSLSWTQVLSQPSKTDIAIKRGHFPGIAGQYCCAERTVLPVESTCCLTRKSVNDLERDCDRRVPGISFWKHNRPPFSVALFSFICFVIASRLVVSNRSTRWR